MHKITFILVAVIFSCLFIYPSYAMPCCCGEKDPEKRPLVKPTLNEEKQARQAQKIKALADLEGAVRSAREKQEKKAKKQANIDCQHMKEEAESQEVSQGAITLTLPKDVTTLLNTDGSKSILYQDISIQMFASHKDVIINNKEVKAIQETPVTLKSGKESLKRRMKQFLYDKIEEKKDAQNRKNYDAIMTCINTVLDTLSAEDLHHIKLTHDNTTTIFLSFFKIKDSALLIKGLNLSPVLNKS